MEIIFLVQESMEKCPVWVVEIGCQGIRTSGSMLVNHSRAGPLWGIGTQYCPFISMNMLWSIWWFWGRDIPLFLDLLMRGNLSKRWISPDIEFQGTWKVSDYTKGVNKLTEEICGREGKNDNGFVLVNSTSKSNQMHIRVWPAKMSR